MGPKRAEKLFATNVQEAGLGISPPPIIESPFPVFDQNGHLKKTKTHPDHLVTRPETGQQVFVEIASGSCNGARKEAQKRVALAAGLESYYVQISGNTVIELDRLSTPQSKRLFLFELFGWK